MTTAKKTAATLAKKSTATASSSPLLAWASSYLGTYGHGLVVVARENGAKSDTATFVVDAHCLGVRRAARATVSTLGFTGKVLPALHTEHHTMPVPPAVALGIIAGAVSFAKSCGFPPADSYAGALEIFGDLEAVAPDFKFGKAGKPHFHPMPGDDEEFAEEVLGKLRRVVGPNGFSYDLDELGEDHLDGDDDAELGEGGEE
jgi:hypothetical protein